MLIIYGWLHHQLLQQHKDLIQVLIWLCTFCYCWQCLTKYWCKCCCTSFSKNNANAAANNCIIPLYCQCWLHFNNAAISIILKLMSTTMASPYYLLLCHHRRYINVNGNIDVNLMTMPKTTLPLILSTVEFVPNNSRHSRRSWDITNSLDSFHIAIIPGYRNIAFIFIMTTPSTIIIIPTFIATRLTKALAIFFDCSSLYYSSRSREGFSISTSIPTVSLSIFYFIFSFSWVTDSSLLCVLSYCGLTS